MYYKRTLPFVIALFLFYSFLIPGKGHADSDIEESFSWSLVMPSFFLADRSEVPEISIAVTFPNGGESIARGTTSKVTWQSSNITGKVTIEIYKGSETIETFTNVNNSGSYDWSLAETGETGDGFTVLIAGIYNGKKISDFSDSTFSITEYVPLCGSKHLYLCTSSNCSGAGGYWYEGACNVSPPQPPEGVVWFRERFWQKVGSENTYTAEGAANYCNNLPLADYTDWQLPGKDELKSLVICDNGTSTPLDDGQPCGSGHTSPTIDSSMVSKNALYWASTKDFTRNWTVNFLLGDSNLMPNGNLYYVRCIRKQ